MRISRKLTALFISFTLLFAAMAGVGAAAATAVPTPPSVPRSLAAAPIAGGLKLTWTAPASNGGAPIDNYTITTVNTVTEAVTTVSVAAPATTINLDTLTPATTYTITMTATNIAGTSSFIC